MHFQKKLGLGFIGFGIAIMLLAYWLTNSGALVFSALLGLMAIFFGAFQIMLSNLALSAKTTAKQASGKPAKSTKAKKPRR